MSKPSEGWFISAHRSNITRLGSLLGNVHQTVNRFRDFGDHLPTYNWSNLSDYDFELVARDVLAITLGKPVEAFTKGRDSGIDLRYENNRTFVLAQAKHYMRSAYDDLVRAVNLEKKKLDEAEKKPTRYILFTTMRLTPKRKKDLHDALKPYCKRDSDIMGVEDIEGVIAAHPEIEEHHYKLWLSSVRVLERILGNATLSRSEMRITQLTRKARLFVPHDELPRAEEILRTERNLIISGEAGIGKTTLAEMLALKFLSRDYSVHFVTKVRELEAALKDGQKQLFIYDDFIGRTNFREAPSSSDQELLFTFMAHTRVTSGKYLVLTTREYLYREVRAANERLKHNRADMVKCVLDVAGYSELNRARILYNHLYWTPEIPLVDLATFVRRRGYRRVIDHRNFNPRFIADTINRLFPAQLSVNDEDEDLWT